MIFDGARNDDLTTNTVSRGFQLLEALAGVLIISLLAYAALVVL